MKSEHFNNSAVHAQEIERTLYQVINEFLSCIKNDVNWK